MEIAELARTGRFADACALADRWLLVIPQDTTLLFAKGTALLDWGRYRDSRVIYEEAERNGLRSALLYQQLGWACFLAGDAEAAIVVLQKAVSSDPRAFKAHFCLGVVLQSQERHDEAAPSFERAVELDPDDFQALLMLGKCKIEQDDAKAAESLFQRAVEIRPEHPAAWTNLGFAFARQDRHTESIVAFNHAYELDASDDQSEVDGFFNLAVGLAGEDRLDEACGLFEANLAAHPAPSAHFNYALALLRLGRFEEAWPHFEFRLLLEPHRSTRALYGKPLWTGQDVTGKRVLIRAEQGIGDMIQFLRYVPQLRGLGASVLLKVPAELEALAEGIAGPGAILPRNETPLDFDFYIHAMSLPSAFGTTLESIPGEIPYIRADDARKVHWRERLGERKALYVGLVWAGNPAHLLDRYRSISFAELAPILAVDGVSFVSLQKGWLGAEIAEANVLDLGPELADFADTAAVIDQLDLIIGVDTAVVHLAGALGKPVWLMLPKPCDWRWLRDREDSPWYPTMRLFRQRRRGEWADVATDVANALHEWQPGARAVSRSAEVAGRGAVEERTSALSPQQSTHSGFSAVAETRYGVIQYLPDEPLVGKSLRWYGDFLQPQVRLLQRMLRPGATVVEIGAGVGAHTLVLAQAVGEAGNVLAYERDRVLRRILRQTIEANCRHNVTLMAVPSTAAPDRSFAVRVPGAGDDANRVPVLDDLRLVRLDFLKIGRGADAPTVFQGAKETIWRLRPVLFVHPADDSRFTSLVDNVKQFAYRCWRMDTPLYEPDNFNRRDTDIFEGLSVPALMAVPEETDVSMESTGCVEFIE